MSDWINVPSGKASIHQHTSRIPLVDKQMIVIVGIALPYMDALYPVVALQA